MEFRYPADKKIDFKLLAAHGQRKLGDYLSLVADRHLADNAELLAKLKVDKRKPRK